MLLTCLPNNGRSNEGFPRGTDEEAAAICLYCFPFTEWEIYLELGHQDFNNVFPIKRVFFSHFYLHQ